MRTIKHGVFTTKLAVFPLASPAYNIAGKHSQHGVRSGMLLTVPVNNSR